MNVDPRLMKQLLQLQFQPSLDGFPLKPSNTPERGTDFADLLDSLLGQAVQEPESAVPLKKPASPPRPLQGLQRPITSAAGSTNVYDPLIADAAARYGVDASLIKAVIHAESAFNPYAVSRAGAKGLMQLMDQTGSQMGVTDPFDPEQNIHGGTRYLASLLRKYDGNVAVALAAYNAGPGRVDALGIRTDGQLMANPGLLPEETQRYITKVLERKRSYMA